MSQLSAVVTFRAVSLPVVYRDNVPYLAAADLARALEYSDTRAVTRIHRLHRDEFTDAMALVVKSTTKGFGNGASAKPTRIFSARGCHLIGMFARTPVAADFRRWVLDVLEGYGQPQPTTALPPPSLINRRWLVSYDHTGHEQVQAVPSDAFVLSIPALLRALATPGDVMVDDRTLIDFIAATSQRLRQRAAYLGRKGSA